MRGRRDVRGRGREEEYIVWKSWRGGVKKLRSGGNMSEGTRKMDGDGGRLKKCSLSEMQVRNTGVGERKKGDE